MSRTYKYPVKKQRNNQYFKRQSNKKNRKWLNTLTKGFKNSKLFKILTNPYDICDYKTYK
jgi:hypothetical protein